MSFKERFRYELGLSAEQKDKVVMIDIITRNVQFGMLKSEHLFNLNPAWWEQQLRIWGNVQIRDSEVENLNKEGKVQWRVFYIRKTGKGYVLDIGMHQLRFNEIIATKLFCMRCKKEGKIEEVQLCEACTKELKKKRQYSEFLWGDLKRELRKQTKEKKEKLKEKQKEKNER